MTPLALPKLHLMEIVAICLVPLWLKCAPNRGAGVLLVFAFVNKSSLLTCSLKCSKFVRLTTSTLYVDFSISRKYGNEFAFKAKSDF